MNYTIFKRLSHRGDSSWNVGPNDWDAICLVIKKDVTICGFSAFALSEAQMKSRLIYKVKVDDNRDIEGSVDIGYSPNKLIKVEFDCGNWIRAYAGSKVVLKHSIADEGCHEYSGNSGKTECEYFSIESVEGDNNGTDSDSGQFPEIFYHC